MATEKSSAWFYVKQKKVQKILRLFDALTGEINHRPIIGLLAVAVSLLHLGMVSLLMLPSDKDTEIKPIKIVEVALVTESSPKTEAPPTPAPPAPEPPKKPPPKKKEAKPPVKKKEPVVPKKVERTKPEPEVVKPTPMPPSLTDFTRKPDITAPSVTSTKTPSKTGTGVAPNKAASSGVVPLVRVKPAYPARAASRHIEGWVKIEFTVSAAGTVSNARVIGASPPGIFDEAALAAIKQWKFKPKIEAGAAVVQRAVQTLKFTLLK